MRWLAVILLCLLANAQADPRSHYMIHCMGCHLADGSGSPPDVPAFDDTVNRLARSEKGRAYLVQVPGAAQSPLTHSELAAVINWIGSHFGNAAFEPFDAAEVARYRRHILTNPLAARQALRTGNH